MKFLKKLAVEGEEPPGNAIKIRKVVEMNVQCDSCDYWGKMNGGPLVGGEKAVFECPECGTLKYIKWMFDNI